MNPKQLKAQRRWLYDTNKKYQTDVFQIVPRNEWPDDVCLYVPFTEKIVLIPQRIRVLRSREHLVQVFDCGDGLVRLSVCRTALDSDGRWDEVLTWQELQDVKDNCGFANCDAVEAYPAKRDIVNVANMRHLWIIPKDQARFFWRADGGPKFSE